MRYLKAILAGALFAALFTTPAYSATPAKCAAYTYVGGGSLCDRFSGRTDVDCDEVGYRVTVGSYDPWRLDGNGPKKGDGIGCESYPIKPRPTVTPTTVPPTTVPPTTPPATTTPATVPPSTTPPPAEGAEPAAEPAATRTTEAAAPALPVTGPAAPVLVAAGALVLGIGVALIVAIRRRRTRFEA